MGACLWVASLPAVWAQGRAATLIAVQGAASVRRSATVYREPGRSPFAHFGRKNVNGYPTIFLVRSVRAGRNCVPAWYRVELPRLYLA